MESFNRKLVIALVIALVIMLLVIAGLATKVATTSRADLGDRSVSVTGEATLKAEPNEYVFYPTYSFKNASKDAALADMTKKSTEVVAGLKKLGIADKDIETNADGSDSPIYYQPLGADIDKSTYSLQLTVTVASKDLAQKVQDYLVASVPTGSVSPQADFSDAKRKELESKARDEATKDARSKADQSAKNLGFKVGKVKTVDDAAGFGVMPYATNEGTVRAMDSGAEPATSPSLAVQAGQNELSYSVTVVYEIK